MNPYPARRPGGPARYEIRLQGHLEPRWAAWFDGLSVTNDSDGTTALRGPVVDQAALHGVLQKVRDTGLPLLSVSRLDPIRPRTSPSPSRPPQKEAT
jgi:hypothetical protein